MAGINRGRVWYYWGMKHRLGFEHLASAFFVVVLVFTMTTAGDYGANVDVEFRKTGSERIWTFYHGLFSGVPYAELMEKVKTDAYPGLYDLILAVINRMSSGSHYTNNGYLALIFGLIGIAGCYKVGAALRGSRAGFFCMLFAVLMPRFYGDMFSNPKDVPFAAIYVWCIYYLLLIIRKLPRPDWQLILKFGVAAGLLMSLRLGGMLVICYLLLIIAVDLIFFERSGTDKKKKLANLLWWLPKVAGVMSVATVLLLFFWPKGQQEFLAIFTDLFKVVHEFKWNSHVMFLGEYYKADAVPVYYLIVWLLISLPEYILFLIPVGVFFVVEDMKTGLKQLLRQNPDYAFLVFSAAFPLAYVLLKKPIFHDGIRHYLFVVLIITCIAALIFDRMLEAFSPEKIRSLNSQPEIMIIDEQPGDPDLKNMKVVEAVWIKHCRVNVIIGLVWAALMLVTVYDMIVLHPYQYIYFNRFIGGLAGAAIEFETDYWGTSLKEAVAAVNKIADGQNQSLKVHAAFSPWLVKRYLADHLEFTDNISEADYFVAFNRWNHHMMHSGRLVYKVERAGVILAVVVKVGGNVQPDWPTENIFVPEL